MQLPLIQPRERRKLVKAQKAELRKRQKLDRAITATAYKTLEDGIPELLSDMEVTTTIPPIAIGPGHLLITCGGFVGCLKCGGVSGTRALKLSGECRNGCPPPVPNGRLLGC